MKKLNIFITTLVIAAFVLTACAPAATETPYRLRELDDWQLVELILPPARGLGEAAEHLEP